MAGDGTTVGKLLRFVLKLFFKLTACLVVELLKFGTLSVMLVASFFIFLCAFVYAVWRSYVSSDGSVPYTLCVTVGMLLLATFAFGVLQYVVKDVLRLTDMTLVEVVLMWLKVKAKPNAKGNPAGVTAKTGGDNSRISEADKDKKL